MPSLFMEIYLPNLSRKINWYQAIKIISVAKWNDSPVPLYSGLSVLKTNKIYQFEIAKILRRIVEK